MLCVYVYNLNNALLFPGLFSDNDDFRTKIVSIVFIGHYSVEHLFGFDYTVKCKHV